MADFLSDMNALTQSVGNAANSITNLYNVRKDLETKRIASQVQAKQYDIMKRVNLPLGDPARISFSQDGGGTYFRDVLDQYDNETQELVGSSKWESVRGAVSSALQPMTQNFSLKIADAYAAQEVEKAQVDWTVAFENELSMAGSEEQVETVKAKYRSMQTKDEIFEPEKFEPIFNQRADSAQANVVLRRAISSPSVAAREADPVPDSSDPSGGASSEKPANTASALDVIANSKATPSAKKQAADGVAAKEKADTAQFKEWRSNMISDRIKAGEDVESERLRSQIVQNGGFVNSAEKDAAIAELDAYDMKKVGGLFNLILNDAYRVAPDGKEVLNAKVPVSMDEVKAIADTYKGFSGTKYGRDMITDTMEKLKNLLRDPDEGSGPELVFETEFSLMSGEIASIVAMSESVGGNDLSRMERLVILKQEADLKLKNATAQGIKATSGYNRFLGDFSGGIRTLSENKEKSTGTARMREDLYDKAFQTVIAGITDESALKYVKKQANLPYDQRDASYNVAMLDLKGAISSYMTNSESWTPAQSESIGRSFQFVVGKFANEMFTSKFDEMAQEKLFSTAQDAVAEFFTGLDSGAFIASSTSKLNNNVMEIPYVSNLVDQGAKMAAEAMARDLKGVKLGDISIIKDPKNGDVILKTTRTEGGKYPVTTLYSLNGEVDDGKSRLVLVDNSNPNNKIYVDGKDVPAVQKKKKEEAQKFMEENWHPAGF